MNNNKIVAVLVLPFLLAGPASADEITDQLQAALVAYEDGDYRTAVDELKYVSAQIEVLKNKQNKTLLPEALEGWTIKPEKKKSNNNPMAMAMMGGGTTISASYLREKEEVEIEVIANSPMLGMVSMMINNPMMMSSDPDIKPFRYKRSKGMIKTRRNEIEMSLLVAGQILVKITGKKLKDDAVLKEYLEAIDMGQLKEALL